MLAQASMKDDKNPRIQKYDKNINGKKFHFVKHTRRKPKKVGSDNTPKDNNSSNNGSDNSDGNNSDDKKGDDGPSGDDNKNSDKKDDSQNKGKNNIPPPPPLSILGTPRKKPSAPAQGQESFTKEEEDSQANQYRLRK